MAAFAAAPAGAAQGDGSFTPSLARKVERGLERQLYPGSEATCHITDHKSVLFCFVDKSGSDFFMLIERGGAVRGSSVFAATVLVKSRYRGFEGCGSGVVFLMDRKGNISTA